MSTDNDSLSENEVEVRSQIINNPESDNSIHENENQREEIQSEENKQDAEGEKEVVKPKSRKKQLYPNPKFNENTVRTPKGLPAILGHFQDVKFKGRGYEEQDLNRLLKTYEYWSHRFYPKYPFDDTIQRLEELGNKRGIQVYLKKIRLGMEDIFNEEVKQQNLEDEEEIPTGGFVEPFDDRFDQLLVSTVPGPEPELTEEQLERIKQNKLRAEIIRREKMSKTGGEISQVLGITSQSENNINKNITEMQANNDEMDVDNILDMINEDDQSQLNSINLQSQHISENQVSNAIRKNAIVTSDVENDDLSSIIREKRKKEHENVPSTSSQMSTLPRNKSFNESSEESEDNISNDSSADSMILNNSLLRKKHRINCGEKLANSSQNALNQIKKLTVSDSEEDLEEIRAQSSQKKFVQKKKIKVLDSDIESSNFSQNSNNISASDEDTSSQSSTKLNKRHNISDSDEDPYLNNIKPQNSTYEKRNGVFDKDKNQKKEQNLSDSDKNSDNETLKSSQKASTSIKLRKRFYSSNSGEDSDSDKAKPLNSKNKKKNDVSNKVKKQKKKKIVSDSDEDLPASQNVLTKTTPIKSSQKIIRKIVEDDKDDSNESLSQESIVNVNDLDKDSGSISSQNASQDKKKTTVIESGEDSNDIRNAPSQTIDDKVSKQNSQNSVHRRKTMVIESDEDSNDVRNSIPEDSVGLKHKNSNKNKKRHIIDSDTSDEENIHKVHLKKKILGSDDEIVHNNVNS